MIVYGDPSRTATLRELLTPLQKQVKAYQSRRKRKGTPTLDELRTLLIQAGQTWQAVADMPGANEEVVSLLQGGTLGAAGLFCLSVVGNNYRSRSSCFVYMANFDEAYDKAEKAGLLDLPLTIKTPEGYAFYCLFPEQYAYASIRWMRDNPLVVNRPQAWSGIRAHIIGVRSIGTSLAAVVREAASSVKKPLSTILHTVRPTGHPWERESEIKLQGAMHEWGYGLVVDEGPGMSGSSMAAVAEALHRAGIPRERIAFFPGHGGDPTQIQSETVQRWWAETPRYVTPLSELRWDGLTLTETLARHTLQLAGEPLSSEDLGALASVEVNASVQIDDMGGGLWRAFVFLREGDWPAATIPFERTKYRCTTPKGTRILWKFAGLGNEKETFAIQRTRAASGWTNEPLGTCLGFLASRWIEGDPFTISNAKPDVLAHIGSYVSDVAGPPLSDETQNVAWDRLAEMLYWNVWEGLGEAEAVRARARFAEAENANRATSRPSYGDGRLAPHEWIRDRQGRIWKTDATGHDQDHTIVGPQPIEWDVAGVLVEWDLWKGHKPAQSASSFLAAVSTIGAATGGPLLTAYVLAYAAFRLGILTLCAQSTSDTSEQERLQSEASCYIALIRTLL